MSTHKDPAIDPLPSLHSWHSLVERSIAAWDSLHFQSDDGRRREKEFLRYYHSLEEFLHDAPKDMMFWFFQRREAFLSQKEMEKWSKDRLTDYILLPATNGSISRRDCFFLSHYWYSKDHPDPDGKYLRLHQDVLKGQEWSYIWVDWICAPQAPRSAAEAIYFERALATVSSIIRNSGFSWYYPPFEPRLWILYEVAEFLLTCSSRFALTSDIQEFSDQVDEMVQSGVQPVLTKYNYRCTNEHDKTFLTSWLELLVLLRRLQINIDDTRKLLDYITWFHTCGLMIIQSYDGLLQLEKYEGNLIFAGKSYTFTPFPVIYATSDPSRERNTWSDHSLILVND